MLDEFRRPTCWAPEVATVSFYSEWVKSYRCRPYRKPRLLTSRHPRPLCAISSAQCTSVPRERGVSRRRTRIFHQLLLQVESNVSTQHRWAWRTGWNSQAHGGSVVSRWFRRSAATQLQAATAAICSWVSSELCCLRSCAGGSHGVVKGAVPRMRALWK